MSSRASVDGIRDELISNFEKYLAKLPGRDRGGLDWSAELKSCLERRLDGEWTFHPVRSSDVLVAALDGDASWRSPMPDSDAPELPQLTPETRAALQAYLTAVAHEVVHDKKHAYAKTLAEQALEVAARRLASISTQVGPSEFGQVTDRQLQSVANDYRIFLRAQFKESVKKVATDVISKVLLNEYSKDCFEHCDFGRCGVRLDYTLAEVSKDDLATIVERMKVPGRSWADLFPDDH